MKTGIAPQRFLTRFNSSILAGVFIILTAVVAIPFYSVKSKSLPAPGSLAASARQQARVKSLAASSANLAAVPSYSIDWNSGGDGKQNFSEDNMKPSYRSTAKTTRLGWAPTLNLPSITGETIAVFAADCTTPKLSFNLGEVVCAKTDGVDLSTPGNFYVDWTGPNGTTNGATITQNPQYSLFALPTSNTEVGLWKPNIGRVSPAENSIIGNPPNFTVSADGPSIAIFASNCTTPQSVFNVQDPDPGKTVCAKVTGGDVNQYILWSNSNFELVRNVPLGTGENSFPLTTGSSVGDWRVILFEPFGGSVYALTPFTVVDTAHPSTDISISTGSIGNSVAAGSQAVFTVQVTNLGPDTSTVQLTDAVPGSTTFVEFAPTSTPLGTNCAKPIGGASSGNVVCSIPNLARGRTAVFLAKYDVIPGTPSNTVISDSASVTSSTPDSASANDSSTATVIVSGAVSETCTLGSPDQRCPANVVVTANTTQGSQFGAFVTYGAASGSGNCGTITNSPASGSFFAVGAHSIVSTSQFGGASCSFTVTVLDTNPPTITCPANIIVNLSSGQTEAIVNPGNPTITASGGGTVTGVRSDDTPATYDNNGTVLTPAVVHSLTMDPYQIGSTGILRTVTDAGGRTASCTQIITVVAAGNRDPVTITCPGHVIATASSGCQTTIPPETIGTPTTNPSDSNVVVVAVRSDGLALSAPFPAGTTHITWTASDTVGTGNDAVVLSVASCTQDVTVNPAGGSDTTPPTFVDTLQEPFPPNINTTTASCTATLDDELGVASATDNCSSSVNITRTGVPRIPCPVPGDLNRTCESFVFPTGTTTIIYTATDAAGNTAVRLQLVTVTESPALPPTIMAPPDVLDAVTGPGATSCGTVVSNATLGTATASDNCPGVTVTRTGVPAGNNFPVGDTFITYTATDRSGNTAMATQKVTVVDNTVPVITAPGPVTLLTGAGATSCSVTVSDLNATLGTAAASDNCPGLSAVTRLGVPAGNTFPLGDTTVTYSVTDASNNTSTATQVVTVVDNTAPVITTNGQTPSMWPPNHKYQTFQLTGFVTGASDNCGGVGINDVVIEKVTSDEIENGNGDGNTMNDIVIAANCKSVQLRSEREGDGNGRVYTITFKVTDTHGNVGRATSRVVVAHNPGETPVDSGVHYTVTGGCP